MSREIKFRAWRPYDKRMAHFEPGFAWHDEYNLWHLSQVQQEHDKEITDVPCEDNIVLMQYTGLKDRNGKEIYEGDVVIGFRGFLKGDGYLKKGFPKKIRYLLEVKWSDGKGVDVGFYLNDISPHPEDAEAAREYFYRSIQHELQESREWDLDGNGDCVWKGINESLEIVGNIYENPELIAETLAAP